MQPTHEQREHFENMARGFLEHLHDVPHQDLVLRMLSSVLRMSGDSRRADLKITASALEEMEHAFDILELHCQQRKVSLFGSARTPSDHPVYRQAVDFARRVRDRGFMVITGAGPGVMAAGNEGAGREHSFGMNIQLPFEAAANEFIAGDPKLIDFKYFFTRKLAFLKDSHAVVVSPGGFGTHDEAFETLTLIQTGKAQLMPLVCMHPEGSDFWDRWDGYVKEVLLGQGMISDADLSLFKVTDSAAEACEEIDRFYRCYHSMRFYRGKLLLRLNHSLKAEELDALNVEFADIVAAGEIEVCSPPDEGDFDSSLKELPHIGLEFVQGRYGRLRQMIDRINGFYSQDECPARPPEKGEGGRMPVETDPGPQA